MRLIGLVLALSLTLAPLAEAQSVGRVPTIGYVTPGAGPGPFGDAFNRGLREAGYIEGRNIVIDRRYMAGREDQCDNVMAPLRRRNGGLILAHGTPRAFV